MDQQTQRRQLPLVSQTQQLEVIISHLQELKASQHLQLGTIHHIYQSTSTLHEHQEALQDTVRLLREEVMFMKDGIAELACLSDTAAMQLRTMSGSMDRLDENVRDLGARLGRLQEHFPDEPEGAHGAPRLRV